MTIVLDSGGLTILAGSRPLLDQLRRRGHWPPIVPAAILTEALTGDHRRDFHENRLLRMCEIIPVGGDLARHAAVLRSQVKTRRSPSAVDAIVVAVADRAGGATVLSSDVGDLRALAGHTTHEVRVESA